jgi:bifunctional non-homologous end joining protein LigD
MSLDTYRKKRVFNKTPEPKGKSSRHKSPKNQQKVPLTFVVQKHEASRLHYDFRLEFKGTLKSWAVPKGPSMNPNDKRLAVMVEDHPLEYANFEGIIPKGNYGAGTVMVWDKGVYTPAAYIEQEKAEELLEEQLNKGHLTFVLLGEKLKGEFALVKSHNGEENQWLLIKAGDEYASPEDILKKDLSVLTGRSMVEIAEQKSNVWHSKTRAVSLDDAPKKTMPHHIKPMLAKSIESPFDDPTYIFEMKYDGYRAIAEVDAGDVTLYSRNGLSFNEKFSPIVTSLKRFPCSAVFDGEVVVIDTQGKPQFQLLQDYPEGKNGELVYYIFDLLYYDGHDLSSLPLIRRKELLRKVVQDYPHIRYSDHIEDTGVAMFTQLQHLEIEGMMAKRKESPYRSGIRAEDWLKIKTKMRQEVVITGFTEPKGLRNHFGALIMGVYDNNKLRYVGHVGGGFNEKNLEQIYHRLQPLVQKDCPFESIPETNAPVTWVKPILLAEVTFSNWTKEGIMRHPIFLGMREDKDASEVTEEKYFAPNPEDTNAEVVTIHNHQLTLTNLSKVFWPDEGYTKGDVIHYYREVAEIILPYLKDRPESLLRYPNGITSKSFYQKDAALLHVDWIEKIGIYSDSNQKTIEYALCQNEAALIYLINLGCIDLNPWSSRVENLTNPDYLLIDLDPLETEFSNVVKTALTCRKLLEHLNVPSYVKTSGATGMHIYIPLGAKYTYEQTRTLAELLCIHVHNAIPEITSLKRSPSERRGRVYLDYLQNIQGQTLASAYSVRAKPGATVSTPLKWSEVTKNLHPSQFTMKNTLQRIQKHGDLFKGVLGKGIDMEKLLNTMMLEKIEKFM